MNNWIVPVLLLAATSASALDGISFRHKDWEIACDNSGTCRMAGYNSDESADLLVSVLLTRAAGNAETLAYFNVTLSQSETVGHSDNAHFVLSRIHLWIDQQDLGLIKQDDKDFYQGQFSKKQTQALLSALKRSAKIKFVATFLDKSVRENELSTQGVNAVMLKADEFQRRLNTPSALIRKGSEKGNILQPQPLPVVNVPKLRAFTTELQPTDPRYQSVLKLLKSVVSDDVSKGCPEIYQENKYAIMLYPLDKQNMLLSTMCQLGAYNSTDLNVLFSADLSKIKQVLDARGEYAGNGEISGSWKSRGLGDCWKNENWAWDGSTFIKTELGTTGDCRGFTGGAWDLPIYDSEVNNPNFN